MHIFTKSLLIVPKLSLWQLRDIMPVVPGNQSLQGCAKVVIVAFQPTSLQNLNNAYQQQQLTA